MSTATPAVAGDDRVQARSSLSTYLGMPAVGAVIGMVLYDLLILKVVIPDILKNGMGPQEGVLKPALIFVFGPTLSLFLFAWTSRADIHWMAPTVL